MKRYFFFPIFLVYIVSFVQGSEPIPESWKSEWERPSVSMRPLQLVHGMDLTKMETVEHFRDRCGLGGLVVNVGGPDYIRNDENWKRFVEGVKNIRKAGLRVWIYDENGYPSLSAGGVVLEQDPSLESLELVYDQGADPPFYVRTAYEHHHAANSYSESRRYPNPLQDAAVAKFIEVTHRRYKKELGPDLYRQVESFFTDEPSTMAVNSTRIPGVDPPYRDPVDPSKKMLASVPWTRDMEDQYKAKYGHDLKPDFGSLFYGTTERDQKIRRNFWTLVGELNQKAFYRQIRKFCMEDPQGPISSGHMLAEENNLRHVPDNGNMLEDLKEFDLPGMDLLTSNPETHFRHGWKTAILPCSAAFFIGQRLVMSETSDHSQRHSARKRCADLNEMCGTAAWQMIWGITEFTLYYRIRDNSSTPPRNEEIHSKYCMYVGRINAILRSAKPVRPLLLYYPIEIYQEDYLPQDTPLRIAKQSKRIQQLDNSYNAIGSSLVKSQIPFLAIDRQTLQELTSKENKGRTKAVCEDFSGIIAPQNGPLPEFHWPINSFIRIQSEEGDLLNTPIHVAKAVEKCAGPRFVFSPANECLAFGAFVRDGRLIFMVSNSKNESWSGKAVFTFPKGMSFEKGIKFDGKGTGSDQLNQFAQKSWTVLNPENGAITSVDPLPDGSGFPVHLDGFKSLLFVSP